MRALVPIPVESIDEWMSRENVAWHTLSILNLTTIYSILLLAGLFAERLNRPPVVVHRVLTAFYFKQNMASSSYHPPCKAVP